MKRFKSILLPMQGKNKSNLNMLYNTVQEEENEKVFSYCGLRFWFAGAGRRNAEKLALYVEIPREMVWDKPVDIEAILTQNKDPIPFESCLLDYLSPVINGLCSKYTNTNKNVREKARFSVQNVNGRIIRRSGMLYDENSDCFIFNISFYVPLLNVLSVNAKAAIRAISDILINIKDSMDCFDKEQCKKYLDCYSKQLQIRKFLNDNEYCAFVADGSVLPRENGRNEPMKNALPFSSPDDLQIKITFKDGTTMSGMGIKKGVTVITGGGYSGKSTLLDAIEMGIYNHSPGDGREYVITNKNALKAYAEDGRPVHNLDMSGFFKYLPGTIDVRRFSTLHASGSVSQAANIIEAVCGGCKLLLIDEDKSATNFMLRDFNMRKIVKREPIIPFTDRVRELYSEKGVSTILVIGGSSEYLSYADTVVLMEDYKAQDITDEIKIMNLPARSCGEAKANWKEERHINLKGTDQPFLYFRSVVNENSKKIILDGYNADITHLTALVSEEQLNTLAFMMERLLTDKRSSHISLNKLAEEITDGIFSPEIGNVMLSFNFKIENRFEEIRAIDIFCCVNRMRGLEFKN